MNISLFHEAIQQTRNQKPVERISIEEFADRTIMGTYQEETNSVRKHSYGTEAYKKAKLAKRHYVVFGGVFSVRNNTGILEPSGVYCLDIDKGVNRSVDFKGLYEELQLDKGFLLVFHSFNGIKILLRGDSTMDSKAYEARHKFYSEIVAKRYNIELDNSMVRISQPCFCSYDPEAEYNENAPVWPYQDIKAISSHKQQTAIAREGGIEYVLDFCQFLVQRKGLKLEPGERHNYLVSLAFLANEYGVPKEELINYTELICPEWFKEQTNAIEWPYDNRQEAHGTKTFSPSKKQSGTEGTEGKKPPSKIEFLQNFIPDNFDVRYNEFTSEYEFDKRPIEDKDINDITNAASQEYYDQYSREINQRHTLSIIESSFTEKCDPVRDFLETVRTKERGAIDETISSLKVDNESSGNEKIIKKWLVNAIALGLDGINNPLLPALLGGQGTGKTYFLRGIIPSELKDYYAEGPIEGDKDSLVRYTQNLIYMDDELSGKAKKKVEEMKAILSKEVIKTRKAYGRKDSRLQRRASFCGTGNEMSILHDYTGNRRIIPIHVISIDHNQYNAVNKGDLWGEAYDLFLSGFDYRLTATEVQDLNRRSGQFEYVEWEVELVNRYLDIGTVEGPNKEYMYTATDIALLLDKHVTKKPVSVVKLGRALKKLGFEPKQTRKEGQEAITVLHS